MKREKYVNVQFNHRGQGAFFMLATFAITLFTMFFMPVKPAWAKRVDVTVTHPVTPADLAQEPIPGQSYYPVLAFQVDTVDGLNGGAGTNQLNEVFVTVSGTAPLTGCSVHVDTGTIGVYDSEPTIGTVSGAGPSYNITGMVQDFPLPPGTINFLVTVNVGSGATSGQTITASIAAGSSGMTIIASGTITYDSVNNSVTHNVYEPPADDVTVTEYNSSLSEPSTVSRSTKYAMFGFNLTSTLGSADLAQAYVYFDAAATATTADISSVELRADDGTTSGKYDASDTLIGTMTWSTDHYQLSSNPTETIPTSPGTDYIMVVQVAAGATSGDTFIFEFNANDWVDVDGTATVNSFGNIVGNTHTIESDTVDVTEYNSSLSEPSTVSRNTKYAMFGFNLTSTLGIADLAEVFVYFDAAATATTADITSVELRVDDGTTSGKYDASDTLVGTMTWSTDHYQMSSNPAETIPTSSGTNFIMVVQVAAGATSSATLIFEFNANDYVDVDGTADTVNSFGNIVGNTHTIAADAVDVTSYSTSETASIDKGSTAAMFGFNLTSAPSGANLNDVKVYFDAAATGSSTDISSVSLYEDDGTTSGQYDGSDTLVGGMSWNTTYYSLTTPNPNYAIATTPGNDFIMVVTVASNAGENNTLVFKFNNDDFVSVDSPDSVNSFTGFTGNQTFTINGDAVTVTSYSTSETTSIDKGSTAAMFGFNLTVDANASNLDDVRIYFDAAATGSSTDISSVSLYEDDGTTSGQYDGSDTLVGGMSWNTTYYSLTTPNPNYAIATSPGNNFIMVVTVATGAGENNTLVFKFNNDDFVSVDSPDTVNSFTGFSGNQTFTINGDAVTVNSYNTSETTSVQKSSTYAMFGFNLTSSPAGANLNDVRIYFDAAATGSSTDISSVSLYEDDGTTSGQYDGSDTLVGGMSWNTTYYSLTTPNPNYAITTSPGNDFIMVCTVAAGAGEGNTFVFKFNNDDFVSVDSPDTVSSFTGFTGNQTFTVAADLVDVTSYSTSETTSIDKGSTAAMFGFNLTSSPAGANLNDVRIYFDAAATGSSSDISSVSLYEDDGTTSGQYDGSDTLVGGMSWNTTYYSLTTPNPNYAIATSPGNDFIMVVTVASGAGDSNTLIFKFNNDDFVGVDPPDGVNSFTGFSGNQTFTINADTVDVTSHNTSEATSVAKLNSYAMFGFNLDTGTTGSATLSDVKVYFNSAATADQNDISSVSLYVDDGTTSGQYDGSDTLVEGMSWNTDHFEITSPPTTSVADASGKNYIMVVTIGSGALDGEIFKFEFSNTNDVTAVSPDTVNAIGLPFVGNQQFSVTSGPPDKLKVSNITVGPTSIFRGDRNVPVLSFSVITSSGSGGNDSITINEVYLNFYEMGSGVIDNFISANMVKFYDDPDKDGTVNNFKGIFSCDSTTCTLGNLSEVVSNVSSNFYIVTGNTTSTPIYSSFKTGINDGGGFALAGADTLAANNPTGVTSGNITQDFDRRMGVGWNLITASKADTTANYSSVFSDDTAPYVPYMIEWSNTNVDSSWDCGTCAWSSTVQNNTMSYGKGYFFFAEEDGQILSTNGGSYATLQHSVSLIKGANIVGNPFNYILPMDATWPATGVYIDNGSTQESLKQASTNGWIEADLFWYNGNTYEAVNVDSAVDPYNYMVPWRGYWIRITETTGSYSIIFKP